MRFKQAKIALAASTGGNLVAAVSGSRIRLRSLLLTVDTAVDVTIKSGSTAIAGPFPLAVGQPLLAPADNDGHLETAVGEALVIAFSGSCDAGGWITYFEA